MGKGLNSAVTKAASTVLMTVLEPQLDKMCSGPSHQRLVYFALPVSTMVSFVSVHTQDGDIIAPELTPLKPSWANANEVEDDEEGVSTEANSVSANGQKTARARLF